MISIPTKIANLLHGLTDDISAAVGSASASVCPFLERNEAPFFPDYTNHGRNHVEKVLKTCELLIDEAGWSVFTREDSAVLVLATLAHDLGMLITIDGFRYLVDPNKVIAPTEKNDEPWYKLWREFKLEARRFDGAMLLNITGSPEPVALQEIEPNGFTERGIRIAGEFLRRYHHRLAQEIVLTGMPTETGAVQLFPSSQNHLNDLAGIVARSHGMPVRDCLEYLLKLDRNGHREFRHIHPTFLMTLVRLADYLDLDVGRAPSSVLAAKALKSPLSRREWWSHMAIVDCHSMTDDPECLHVVVDSSVLPDVMTFSVIEAKINGIQQELDACWAVLGEVYGRFPPLNKLALKIRRLQSNIRAESTVLKLPFVPHVASLESARADLLKLLIQPLYGDHPGIGVRELIQNAIDAVRELEYILPSIKQHVDRADIDGDVNVTLEKNNKGEYWVTIADRGIGMNWITVCRYFLTAGASFRQSELWKKRFADNDGTSHVLRSGRFGIGVLAAFLLGDRIKVSSRHVEEPENRGIEFEFGLDDVSIEMRWAKRKIGTTVQIRTSEQIIEKFESDSWYSDVLDKWDWYCLAKPLLVRRTTDGYISKQKYSLPGPDDELPDHWHRIQVLGYQMIHWTYRANVPELVCNGILIPYRYRAVDISEQFGNTELCLQEPHVSIFDPDGRLPLSLARDQLAHTPHDIASTLADDVCRNFIAFCLIKGPKEKLIGSDSFSYYSRTGYTGQFYERRISWFFDSKNGFGLSDPWNISYFISTPALILRSADRYFKMPSTAADISTPTYGIFLNSLSDGNLTSFDYWIRSLVLYNTSERFSSFNGLNIKGLRILTSKRWYKRFAEKQRRFVVKLSRIRWETNDWVIWTVGHCSGDESALQSMAEEFKANHTSIECAAECYLSPPVKEPEPGRIARLWRDVIGGPVIPFGVKERQEILNKLDKQFERHIVEWKNTETSRRKRTP